MNDNSSRSGMGESLFRLVESEAHMRLSDLLVGAPKGTSQEVSFSVPVWVKMKVSDSPDPAMPAGGEVCCIRMKRSDGVEISVGTCC